MPNILINCGKGLVKILFEFRREDVDYDVAFYKALELYKGNQPIILCCMHVYGSRLSLRARFFFKKKLVVSFYLMNLSFKFR